MSANSALIIMHIYGTYPITLKLYQNIENAILNNNHEKMARSIRDLFKIEI